MKKIKFISTIIFLICFFALKITTVSADVATCREECLANGNTSSECNAICENEGNSEEENIGNIFDGPTNATFDTLNPLKMDSENADLADKLSTPGGIITRTLNFLFPISGLILFVMIVWGGFEVLAGSSSGKSLDAGKQRITAAIIGFLLLFSSYWLIQIIEVVFGLVIVG